MTRPDYPDPFAALAHDLAASGRKWRVLRLTWKVAEWLVFFAAGFCAAWRWV
jgi:hypothetical protein